MQGANDNTLKAQDLNVFGEPLVPCGLDPMTGFFRDGCCSTGSDDLGSHTVCAQMTQAFLEYSLAQGNDLMTPMPAFRFPGLKPGDKWCLCADRWREAFEAGVAPGVHLQSTHQRSIEIVDLDDLKTHAVDLT